MLQTRTFGRHYVQTRCSFLLISNQSDARKVMTDFKLISLRRQVQPASFSIDGLHRSVPCYRREGLVASAMAAEGGLEHLLGKVVIVGGGPVGCSIAALLAQSGKNSPVD